MILHATLILGVFLIVSPTGNAESSRLTGIRYNVRETKSRVTFRFTGTMFYSADKKGDIITLVFRNVSVGSPPGEARLSFVSGTVQGVTLHRAGKDSAIASIRLRSDDRVEYSSSENGHDLYVDVVGSGHRAGVRQSSAAAASASPAQKTPESVAISPPPAEVSSNKIQNVDQPVPVPELEKYAGRTMPARQESSDPGLLISILLSLTISSAGTIAILWLYVRRQCVKQHSEVGPADRIAPESAAEGFSLPQLSVPATPDPFGSPVLSALPDAEGDDPGLALAERFQRSRSELDFAIQVSSVPYPNGVAKTLAGKDAALLTKAQRTVVAKKLGVGRGELDLMANISRMQEQAKEANHD